MAKIFVIGVSGLLIDKFFPVILRVTKYNKRVHEAGIMHNILSMAENTAREQNATRILKLTVRVGSMTGVVPDALQFAFEALRSGTIAEDAELEIEIVPALLFCENCGIEFEPNEVDFLCPRCGQGNIKLRKGRELELTSIEYI